VYSDLLFAVSGDPIDVRESIYGTFCKNSILFFYKIKPKKIL
jgi:hypothetical protein